MINLRDNLIIIDNRNETKNIEHIVESNAKLYKVLFNNYYGNKKYYSYSKDRVLWLNNPDYLNINDYIVFGKYNNKLNNLKHISVFSINKKAYKVYIEFNNGQDKYYDYNDLKILKNSINEVSVAHAIKYLKEICKLNKLKIQNDTSNTEEKTLGSLLYKQFEQLAFIEEGSPVNCFLKRQRWRSDNTKSNSNDLYIFPFGCNNSQMNAVNNAFNNKISIIEGPPGTGKTQTILNILSNIIMKNKTALVVSNNNSAIENVQEKMKKYGYDFIIAKLGNCDNKDSFINNQTNEFELLKEWEHLECNGIDFKHKLLDLKNRLTKVYSINELISMQEKELSSLVLQNKYLSKYINDYFSYLNVYKIRNNLPSKVLYKVWNRLNLKSIYGKTSVSFFEKILYCLIKGIGSFDLYNLSINEILLVIQKYYYSNRKLELEDLLSKNKSFINNTETVRIKNDFETLSKICFEKVLFEKYNGLNHTIFKLEDLNKNWNKFIDEYPIILSTTYSAKKSLSSDCIYDYLIMDEASQVDIATGTLAMTCARNIIIIGDLKQLPNVVSDKDLTEFDKLLDKYDIPKEFSFKNSFMKSVDDVIKPPKTLLKEHYRCHPKIIEFCNQKFYNGELLIMTKDNNERDVVELYRTNIGNHQRNNYSERQIDIIFNEIIPKLQIADMSLVGIITPYREQAQQIKSHCKNNDLEVDTVHKFQGREKDIIILSTVSDYINEFVDNPNLLNVAISRAKKKFILILSGNEQKDNLNLIDLVHYIEYNNFSINDSKINSIFDLLYKQYTNERIQYLKSHKKVSEYDSENLMYALITEILNENKFDRLDVVLHYPLRYLCNSFDNLTSNEIEYVNRDGTHLDFLIYNKFNKMPQLAIEVDGYKYHKLGTKQHKKDKIKDSILDKINIKHLRFKTNGSCEKERILECLV